MIFIEAYNNSVPIWERYLLTVKESAEYFNIGENKLREMVKEVGCEFAIHIGKKSLINKKKLEQYLDNVGYL